MTNHIHIIIRSKSEKLSDTIRDFKKYTSKKILQSIKNNTIESRKEWLLMIFRYHAKYNKRVNDQQLWTHENHAIELTFANMLSERINYIHENPVRAGWVEKAEDYLYSSARNYIRLKGLLEIDIF